MAAHRTNGPARDDLPSRWLLVAVSILFLSFACDSSLPGRKRYYLADGGAPADGPTATPTAAVRAKDAPSTQQKRTRNAELELEVEDVERAIEEIEALANSQGGLVAGAELSRTQDGRRHGTLTLQVPSASLDDSLDRLKRLGEPIRERLTTQDITKSYMDLETRLSVKRQAEQRVRELLESHTGKIADVLEAERELDRLVAEIEQLLGDKRYYDHQIAMSSIVVAIREPGAVVRPGLLDPVRSAFRNALDVLAVSVGALVYLTVFLVPWLIVASLVWFLVAWMWRRRRDSRRGPVTRGPSA